MMFSNNPDITAACAARYGWTLLVLLAFAFYSCYLWLAVPESPRMEFFFSLTPWLIIPYQVCGSVYAGLWIVRTSSGPGHYRWLSGIGAGILTLGFGMGFPGLVSQFLHYRGLSVFGRPAFLFFMAPVLAIFLIQFCATLLMGRPPNRQGGTHRN